MSPAMQARLTVGLAVACAVSGVLAIAFWAGLGTGYGFDEPADGQRQPLPSIASVANQDFTMPAFSNYVEVAQRPLFNPDRRPVPLDEKDNKNEQPVKPPVPLRVALTGIIITPEVKLALFMDQTTRKPVSLKVGMPLPGEQSGWQLVEISPREVVFKNARDEESRIELKTVGQNTPEPANDRVTATGRRTGAGSQSQSQSQSNPPGGVVGRRIEMDEDSRANLRKRIEERRKQLRERARKIREERERKRAQESS